MKIWHLKNDIYHIDTFLIIEKNKDVVKRYLEKKYRLNKDDADELIAADGCCSWLKHTESGKKVYFIWMPTWHGWVTEISILGHEVIHAVNYHFHDSGVEAGESAESFAYYFEYLFKQCLKKLSGRK